MVDAETTRVISRGCASSLSLSLSPVCQYEGRTVDPTELRLSGGAGGGRERAQRHRIGGSSQMDLVQLRNERGEGG